MAVKTESRGQKRSLIAAVTCMALAGAMMLPVPDLSIVQPPPDSVKVDMALAEIQSGEAEEKAADVASEDGLVAGGAPCFMRHKRMVLGVPQPLRARFAAATIATSSKTKAELLASLVPDVQPGPVAWRIALAQAEVALRSGQTEAALVFLDVAAGEEVPSTCRADEFFLRASVESLAHAADLLDAAVAADPGYWDAQERLAILAAAGTGSDPAACDADAARTIRSATQLAALAQSDSQFQRLQRALVGIGDNTRSALLQGMITRATGQPKIALQTWRTGLEALTSLPCDQVLRRALEGMIANTEEQT